MSDIIFLPRIWGTRDDDGDNESGGGRGHVFFVVVFFVLFVLLRLVVRLPRLAFCRTSLSLLHLKVCTQRRVPEEYLSLWLWLPSYALEDLYQWTHKKFLVPEVSKSQRRPGSSRATSSPQIPGKNIVSLLSIELTKNFRILETKLLWIDKKF